MLTLWLRRQSGGADVASSDPSTKAFTLDLRGLSNRSMAEIRSELGKCVLLCANCHAEVHFPQLSLHARL
jgi:hypothetical protein